MEEVGKRQIKKPGISDNKSKALDSLLKAKTYGIKRTEQYEAISEEEIGEKSEKHESDDGLDDFIDKDGFDYEEGQEVLEEQHRKKKKKKESQGVSNIYSFMKPVTTTNGSAPKKQKESSKVVKITENQSKDIMESLFNDFYDNPVNSIIQTEQNNIQNPVFHEKKFVGLNRLEQSLQEFDYTVNVKKQENNNKIQNEQDNQNQPIEENCNMEIETPIEEPYKIKITPNIKTNGQKIKTETPIISKLPEIKESSIQKINLFENRPKIEPKLEQIQVSNKIEPEQIKLSEISSIEKSEEKDWAAINNNNELLLSDTKNIVQDSSLVLDNEGNLLFYYYDAFEDSQIYPGQVFLFGKALNKITGNYESVSIVIKNMQRNIYFVHKEDMMFANVNEELEELKKKYFSKYLFSWSKQVVRRKYAFELPFSYEEREYTLVKYGYEFPALSVDLKGKTFDGIIGSTYSALESLLLKRKIKGPQWLLLKKGSFAPAKPVRTWCGFEFVVEKKKDLHVVSRDMKLSTPPFKTLCFSMKTLKPDKTKKQEILMISAVFTCNVNVDTVDKSNSNSQAFSVIRKLDNQNFPVGFESKIKINNKNIKIVPNEYALIDFFINKVNSLDPDIIVGHDLYSTLFEKLINRIGDKKIISWSKLGKLQKGNLPKGNSSLYKIRNVTVGRLLCDTYLSARELVREPDYSLEHLSKVHLSKERKTWDPEFYPKAFDQCESLFEFVEGTAYDAYLTMELLAKLQILQLTKELTSIAGNLWIKSLQNSRAERNEMLLMHEFYSQGYLFPDKLTYQQEEKEKALLEDEKTEKKNKKTQKYAGGLVLDPQRGLYDKYILLLDFNSLYPSLIQEYNICFTTVKRPSIPIEKLLLKNKTNSNQTEDNKPIEENEENEDVIDLEKTNSILPKVIKSLVDKRRLVKNQLKKAVSFEEKQTLDIKQKALKLIANSIYGCLGFSSSRFYAQPLAALITKKGRETLKKAVALVSKLNYQVIYGDTDSIMINTNCDHDKLGDAIKAGYAIRKEINALSINKKLEIDIDGVFKPMLLLRKKKYAAKKIANLPDIMLNPNIEPKFVQEFKGLDMVRRDWCDLSKNCSQKILDIVLECGNKEEVVMAILETIREINEKLKKPCSLREFLITKQLTKHPNDYPNGKTLPHVNVAKKLKENGESDNNLIGHFIHYVICKGDNKNLAERAYHPREFKEKEKELEIDIPYYKSQQIMPPLIRLCEFIEGLNITELAECLELDGTRYKSIGQTDKDVFEAEINTQDNEINLNLTHDHIKLEIFCVVCKSLKEYKGIWNNDFKMFGIICSDCGKTFQQSILLNSIMKYLKEQCDRYYEGVTICQEATCGTKSKQLRLKEEKCVTFDCKSKVLHTFQEKRIFNNLRFLKNSFDYQNHSKLVGLEIKADGNILAILDDCKTKIQNYLDRCTVNLGNIFGIKKKII